VSESPPISRAAIFRGEDVATVDGALEAAVCCALAGHLVMGRWGNGVEILFSWWRVAFRDNPQRGALHALNRGPRNPYRLICERVEQLDLERTHRHGRKADDDMASSVVGDGFPDEHWPQLRVSVELARLLALWHSGAPK
jgi:hypothetical protein